MVSHAVRLFLDGWAVIVQDGVALPVNLTNGEQI
jgi:hypothetical protein